MDTRKEKASVPQFGAWDQGSTFTNYSMVFSRARQNRKQHKTEFKRPSIDDEKELTNQLDVQKTPSKRSKENPIRKGKKMRTYLTCCKA